MSGTAFGTAGFFVAAGDLSGVEIPYTGLTGETDYELFLVVDINDSGSYTNVAGGGFTTPVI